MSRPILILLLAIELAQKEPAKKIYVYPEIDHLELRSKTAFYLHGYIAEGSTPDPDKIVLCKDDFDRAYHPGQSQLPMFWESLLSQCPVLFLGCELGEPELELIFLRCNAIRETLNHRYDIRAKRRFALLPHKDILTAESRDPSIEENAGKVSDDLRARFEKYDIKIVNYDARDVAYSGLVEVLQEWAQRPTASVYSYSDGEIPYE